MNKAGKKSVKRKLASSALGAKAKGQALLWFLGTLAASAAVFFAVYNTGQMTAAKQKTVNAADAGALAAAATQARMLNTMAYGNRAIIANEVFIVQMVSLDSWLRYIQTAAQNIGTVANIVPVIGQAIAGFFRVVEQIASRSEQILSNGFPRALQIYNVTIKRAVNIMQEGYALGGSAIAQDVARRVVAENKTDFGGRVDSAPTVPMELGNNLAFAGVNAADWLNFTRQYSGNDRARSRDVILASRDRFSTENGRDGTFFTDFDMWPLAQSNKDGGTRLRGFNRWEAQDAWDFSARWNWTKGRWNLNVPIAWGRATLDERQTRGDKWGNSQARRFAYRSTNMFEGWQGIPSLYDVRNRNDRDPRVSFMLFVVKAGSATPTARKLNMGRPTNGIWGSPNADEQLLGNRVSALAQAEAYFARPQRGLNDWTADAWPGGATLFRQDGAKEYGSLYNPFWQARLAPVSDAAKVAASAAAGQIIPPGVLQ